MIPTRTGIAALALVNAALAGLIWQVWNTSPEQSAALPAAASQYRIALPTINGVKHHNDARMARLFGSVAEVAKVVPAPRPITEAVVNQNLRLIGVMMSEVGREEEPPIALVEYGSPRKSLRLRPGEAIPDLGLRVVSIQRDSIEFETKGGRVLKKLQ